MVQATRTSVRAGFKSAISIRTVMMIFYIQTAMHLTIFLHRVDPGMEPMAGK